MAFLTTYLICIARHRIVIFNVVFLVVIAFMIVKSLLDCSYSPTHS